MSLRRFARDAGDWEYRIFLRNASEAVTAAFFERYGNGKSKRNKRTDIYVPAGSLVGIKVRDLESVPVGATITAALSRETLELKIEHDSSDAKATLLDKYEGLSLDGCRELLLKYPRHEQTLKDLEDGIAGNKLVVMRKERQKDGKGGLSHEATLCTVQIVSLGAVAAGHGGDAGHAAELAGQWLSVCLEHAKYDKLERHIATLDEFIAMHGVEKADVFVGSYAAFVHHVCAAAAPDVPLS